MFYEYEPNVKATIRFLKLLKVPVTNSTVNETLQNHPDWPSMVCITDSLQKWNVANGVGKMEKEQIDELPVPFIACTHDKEHPLVIVSEVTSTHIHCYQKEYVAPVRVNRQEFLEQWNGIYLIAEPDVHSGEHDYAKTRNRLFFTALLPIAAAIVLLLLSLLSLNSHIRTASSVAGIYIQYFILVAGVVVTSLLVWYELDRNNPVLQKVCTGIIKGNCNHILTSKAAKVVSWLSWSEIGFFYFTGGLLALTFVQDAIVPVAWLNMLALPYLLFSIYYQWQVAKQWCILCLFVQALLLLGGVNIMFNDMLPGLQKVSLVYILATGLLYVLPVLTWFTVKPALLRLQEAKNTRREYLRVKFNAEIFDTLLRKQRKLSLSSEGLGIELGNAAAKNTLVKVCNPYCGPCAKAHAKIENLLEHNKNIKARIIFAVPNNDLHPGIKPVRHLMAIAAEGNAVKTRQALDDWYLAETKDYEIFEKKYPMNGELQQQGNKIEVMEGWCREIDIMHTPTIFINGQQLPEAYDIEDLHYFLLE